MAKDKPVIRRCSFCFERFEEPLNAHYIDPKQPGSKRNCKDTYNLLGSGWRQSDTGVWHK